MDEFGCYRDNEDDYQELAAKVRSQGNIVFAYSPDRASAYVVTMVRKFEKLGVLPFGGNPDGCILVSVLFWGSFWFRFTNSTTKEFSAEYVGSKLGLSDFDAVQITKLLDGVQRYYYDDTRPENDMAI